MSKQTRLYAAIEGHLDGTLADFIAARRPQTSWREIADELSVITRIPISYESLRMWFADRITVETEVTVS